MSVLAEPLKSDIPVLKDVTSVAPVLDSQTTTSFSEPKQTISFSNVDEVERAYLNNKLELGTKIVVRIKETHLSGGEEDNVEHLRMLINIVVGEGIVESKAVCRHPTCRQTEPIPINIFKSPQQRISVLVEVVPLPLIHRT